MFPRVWVRCVSALWVCACVYAVCPPCPPSPSPRCREGGATADECFYRIDNITDSFIYTTTALYFELRCVEGLTLEERALPVFPARGAVPKVTLERCGAPGGGRSYQQALARLNLTALDQLSLRNLPASPPLRRTHFLQLTSLRTLHITAGPQPLSIPDTEATIFAALINLTSLKLTNVHLSAAAMTNITSKSLSSLDLINCSVGTVPAQWLCSLPALRRLTVRDETLQRLESSCALTALYLTAPRLAQLPPLRSLLELTLTMKEAVTLESCESLKKLSVTLTSARALPAGWLCRCSALEELRLRLPGVTALAATALAGLTALTTLTIDSGYNLHQLQSGLFLDTRNIHTLTLSRNNLTELPSDLFAPLTRLRSLQMPQCGLSARSLDALSGLLLRRLNLDHNALGDICPSQSTTFLGKQRSILATLSELEELSLWNTGTTRICPDWRDFPRLQTLDLRANNITELSWEDFKWRQREIPTKVLLANNPLTAITVSQTEYEAAPVLSDNIMVKFILEQESNEPLRCDCYMYWFAKALEKGAVGVRFENLRCLALGRDQDRDRDQDQYYRPEDSVPIELMPTKNMECTFPGACPVICSCAVSPARGAVVVRCAGQRGSLPDLSLVAGGLQPGDRLVLEAANVGLHSLPPRLPPALRELDLRHNRLGTGGEGEGDWEELFAAERRVLLAGNPLDCGCTQPLFAQISEHIEQVIDKNNVQCADERNIMDAVRSCFAGRGRWVGGAVWGAAGGGGAVALLLAAAVLLGLRRAVRLRLKAFLLARGLCLRWAKPSDDGDYKYDVFISYAHQDSEVAEEVVCVLERGGLRACVHHRDWAPGDWIPNQIAMSVARSRRTVVLLSAHFVQSGWARAEFREASGRALREGGEPPLVVVLGEGPPPGLDREMRRYVTNNTYLRWGEPAFWEKLKVALPQPRGPPPRTAPPAPFSMPAPVPPTFPLPTQSPATPIVKFTEMDFPTSDKPLKQETSPCA